MAKEPAERAVLCSAEADRQGRVRQVRQVRSGRSGRSGQVRSGPVQQVRLDGREGGEGRG